MSANWPPLQLHELIGIAGMLAVGRQGCFEAAFEFCKLLLGLAPAQDPCGVLQVLLELNRQQLQRALVVQNAARMFRMRFVGWPCTGFAEYR